MSWAYTFVQALQAAGEDLTREGLVDALEEVGSATWRGRTSRRTATARTATSASPGSSW